MQKNIRTVLSLWGMLCLVVISTLSCSVSRYFRFTQDATLAKKIAHTIPDYPNATFIVASDLHIYNVMLGTEGRAFEARSMATPVLIKESSFILDTFIAKAKKAAPDFVIIPGDLTHQGEKNSHLLVAEMLSSLTEAGIPVFVVPGNHDVNNRYAYRYTGDERSAEKTVTPSLFKEIYDGFGYADAIFRDTASLSYVAEPVKGLWLLALDSCGYATDEPRTGPPSFTREQILFIEDALATAHERGKAVFVVMHHSVLPRFKKYDRYFPFYIMRDWKDVARLFAAYNARVLFTGHFHSQDITRHERKGNPGKVLYDVETGSLVSYPCPYRECAIASNRLTIRTRYIDAISTFEGSFPLYAESMFMKGATRGVYNRILAHGAFAHEEVSNVAWQVARAYREHAKGDEVATPPLLDRTGLSFPFRIPVAMRRGLVRGLWHDLPPADNNIVIDLQSGRWSAVEPVPDEGRRGVSNAK